MNACGPAASGAMPAASSVDRNLAAFVCEAAPPETARRHAVSAILDTLAVMVAGGGEPAARRLRAALTPAQGEGAVASLWHAEAFRAEDAALLFGLCSHVLDYDDVSMLTVCHPSAPVLSAALAAVPLDTVSGAAFVDAFSIGTEVLIRVGQAMGFRHYALGFHATATLGTLGAAAAAARLMRLDAVRTGHALAIAASLAGGLRKNFGSMVKSLHVGIAAADGIRAARLAATGIEGAAAPLENEGFLHAFSGGEVDHWPDGLGLGVPFAVDEPGFEQKRYPCCYLLHKMIEATLRLRREEGIDLGDVAKAVVTMPRGGTKPLIHPFPRSGLNALFSGPHAVVAALHDGSINLASFTDAAVLRPAIQARLKDVELVEAGPELSRGGDIGAAPVSVRLLLTNGAEVSREVVASPGSRQDPLTRAQLQDKWRDCLARGLPGLGADVAERLFAEGEGLAELPQVAPWLTGLRGA
ncbi:MULTISPECIES: MmgE/PrpD family protein [unclassified Xanthobacter]|uniref:MmgE/PrpD family protein n=1 Tax=unclassified Xanthobacter TaxID=2623496 RepID=UPI001F1CEDFF|nr:MULTISPECIES: MmgE/PrpD family protein [unclassified Xanthobacter]